MLSASLNKTIPSFLHLIKKPCQAAFSIKISKLLICFCSLDLFCPIGLLEKINFITNLYIVLSILFKPCLFQSKYRNSHMQSDISNNKLYMFYVCLHDPESYIVTEGPSASGWLINWIVMCLYSVMICHRLSLWHRLFLVPASAPQLV